MREPSYNDVLAMARATLPYECLACGRKDRLLVTRLEAVPPRNLRRRNGLTGANVYSISVKDYIRLCQPCRSSYRGHGPNRDISRVRRVLSEILGPAK